MFKALLVSAALMLSFNAFAGHRLEDIPLHDPHMRHCVSLERVQYVDRYGRVVSTERCRLYQYEAPRVIVEHVHYHGCGHYYERIPRRTYHDTLHDVHDTLRVIDHGIHTYQHYRWSRERW